MSEPTPRELGEEAVRRLLGTCDAIYNLGEEFEAAENDMAFCDVLDDAIFCCTGCGWWFEQPAEEVNSEWYCEECAQEKTDG